MECDAEALIDNEQKHIDAIAPAYNVSPTAGSVAGVIRSEEYRQKQSVSQRGKTISPSTRAKISAGMIGKKNGLGVHREFSEETKDKIRNKLIGHPVSEETRMKISAKNKGFRHTDESKKKISMAGIGNKYNLGRIQSKEERAKRGLAQKAAWERRKRQAEMQLNDKYQD